MHNDNNDAWLKYIEIIEMTFHGFPWLSMAFHGFPWLSMAFTSEAAAIAAARALLELVPFKDPSHELGVSGDPVASRLVNSHLPSGPIGSHLSIKSIEFIWK